MGLRDLSLGPIRCKLERNMFFFFGLLAYGTPDHFEVPSSLNLGASYSIDVP